MKWKMILIIGIVLAVIIGGLFMINSQGYTAESPYEFSYNDTSGIYSQDLATIKTEITDTGDITLSKWNKEVSLTIEKPNVYPALELSSVSTSLNNKLISKTSDKVDLNYYFKNFSNVDGFEYEVVLKEKPSTNVVSFNINSENLSFYYQPALNIQYNNLSCNETDCQGAHRPENVVGSYAVYHSSKSNNEYMTGKAFHIYRPLVTDADNKSVWAELNIEDGIMSITINQSWLDKAVYPVIVDPSFGYTETGGSSYNSNFNDYWRGTLGIPTSSGTVNSISISCNQYLGFGGNFKAVLVLNSTMNIVTNGVGGTVAVPDTKNWAVANYSTRPNVIAGTAYYAGMVGDTNPITFYYDAGNVNDSLEDSSNSYTTPTNPTDAQNYGDKLSIFANYTYLGVNAGFVTVAPVNDPLGLTWTNVTKMASDDTTPPINVTITEIGFWVDNSSTGNFTVYIDNSGRSNIYSQGGGTLTGSAGWQKITGLNWALNASTLYYLKTISSDFTANYGTVIGHTFYYDAYGSGIGNTMGMIYAVYTTGAADTEYPIFFNYWDNNGSLIGSGTGKFNATINNTNATAGVSFNGVNYTAINISSVFNTSLTATSGSYTYYWWAYGNGTSHNYNQSATRSYTVNASADTCTYSSGNWRVNCSDNCTISSTVNGNAGSNFSLTGKGRFTLNSNVRGFRNYIINNQCNVIQNNGANLF